MSAEDAASASRRIRTLRPIVIACAVVLGALLSGLVASMQGSLALAVFTFRLVRVGFFKNWMIAITYAGRSLIVLTIVVLVTAILGAITWSIGVLTWSMMADRTSRARVTSDKIWSRLQSFL